MADKMAGRGDGAGAREAGAAGSPDFRELDRFWRDFWGQALGGLSPQAYGLAFLDWAGHLAASPGRQAELAAAGLRIAQDYFAYLAAAVGDPDPRPPFAPERDDRRFAAEEWGKPPFSLVEQAFLAAETFARAAFSNVPGVGAHNEKLADFAVRQFFDMVAPSNAPLLNPEVLRRAKETGGASLLAGFRNWIDDLARLAGGARPEGAERFRPGFEVAATPGEVIFRNELIELIQYAPATQTVFAAPVLLVPAWIMKYYVLDLDPEHSLVRHLVERGHTVFCVSWRNPDEAQRDLGLDDYRRLGVMAALDAIGAAAPGRGVHGVGYCLGGTLLALAGAAMARAGDGRLASLSLLAAQTDFSEPGELSLFIDESQLEALSGSMESRGYLTGAQMAGAFQMLRANDLLWSRVAHEYFMGERAPMNALMAWNADTTRMPARMHEEYLRRFYLHNDMAEGRLVVDGHAVALQNLRAPIFALGAERDHVAPWRSVFKILRYARGPATFALASGGHNAGILAEPGHPHAHFRMATAGPEDFLLSPDEWLAATPVREGSWQEGWFDWLARRSEAEGRVTPPALKKGLGAAPGQYVLTP